MRIACAVIPRFALAVEVLERPELRSRPLVLGGAPEETRVVVECSPAAEQQGVRRGMPLREARAYCREALFLEARPAHYRERHEWMLAALEAISPMVEAAEPGRAYIGLNGLAGRSGSAEEASPGVRDGYQLLFATEGAAAGAMTEAVTAALGLRPHIGIAESRFAALAAALSARDGEARILERREVAAFLAPLPVHLLPFDETALRRLYWLGLRRVGDLATLPRAALAAQFGPAGERAWDLAHGVDDLPLVPRRLPAELSGQLAFSQPVTEVQAVLAAARYLLVRLLNRPGRRGRVARGVVLSIALANGQRWERSLTFREPTADGERILRALGAKLDGAAFPAAAEALTLALRDLCGETGVQASLFTARGRQLQELKAALEQLRSRFGHPSVMKIVGVEPWSRIPERQYALIDCEPSISPGP
ncbi:MAG TPA: DNA polymerase Y family protein [Dehalococcoidia bacterium]|jgi:nucleotidyltransferase/DNA polymerase involved in DNA repair